MKLQGFICYSRTDSTSIERLEVHLALVSLRYGVEFWRDKRVNAGSDWDAAIQGKLARANIFVVVLTPDFFASAYIQTKEWPAIMARLAAGCLIVPIVLKNCMWEPFLSAHGNLQAVPTLLPTNRLEPVTSRLWRGENGFVEAAKAIQAAIIAKFQPSETWTGPQSAPGLRFVPEQPTAGGDVERGIIETSSEVLDADTAQTSYMQQLHYAAMQQSLALKEELGRLDNQPTWRPFVEAVSALPNALGPSAQDLAKHLGEAWVLLQCLGVASGHDDDITNGKDSDAGPLGSVRRVRLNQLTATLGTLLGCFPTITQILIPSLLAVESKQVSVEAINVLMHRAIDEGLLNPESGKFLGMLIETSKGDHEAASQIRDLLLPTSRNLGFFILAIATATAATPYESWSTLQRRSRSFAQANRAVLMEVGKGNPGASAAIDALQKGLGSPVPEYSAIDLPRERSEPAAEVGALNTYERIGVDLEALRKDILRGLEPTAAQAPYVKKLVLSGTNIEDLQILSRLSALRELWLDRTPVRDISPLARFPALHTLSLESTKIRDITPLSFLATLRRLSLRGTHVETLQPLSGLRSLTRLALSGSSFTDTSSLGSLRALRELWLNFTDISNIDWVRSLKGLRKLDVSYTGVDTLEAIKTCSNLVRLNVSETKISDLKPLSELRELQTIDIRGTSIRDMVPVESLPKLTRIIVGRKTMADHLLWSISDKTSKDLRNSRWRYLSRPFGNSVIMRIGT